MGCLCGMARTKRTRNIHRTVVPEPLGKLSRTEIHINHYKMMFCQVSSVTVTRVTLRYGHKVNIAPENSDTQFQTADRNQPARVPAEYVECVEGRAGQGRTGQGRAGRAGQGRAGQGRLHCTVHNVASGILTFVHAT